MLTFDERWLDPGESLICLGDSLTESAPGYVSILEERLSVQDISVIRAGVGGDKTPSALMRLQTDVIARKPDAVSIFLGTNDAAIGHWCWADEPCISSQTYGENLRWIVHLCRLAGISKFSITPPLYRFEGDAFRHFGDVLTPYCIAAREASEAVQACFVPAEVAFAEAWMRNPRHTGLLYTVDGIHLTEEGNRLLADTMLCAWGV